MKKSILGIFLLGLFSLSAHAGRGVIVGNGGHTVACARTDGPGLVYETFDLFDGRVLFNFQYPAYNDEDPLDLAYRLAKKIDAAQVKETNVAQRVRKVARYMIFLRPGETLEPTGDAAEYQTIPDHCRLVQTINFRGPRKILVNSDVWKSLSNLDKAALYLHEAVYWYLRGTGVENDSRRTRRIVSYLMAGGELEDLGTIPEEAEGVGQFCHSVEPLTPGHWKTEFLAFKTKNGDAVLQFFQAAGYRFFNRVLIKNPLSADSELPIDANRSEVRTLIGLIRFPVDIESVLDLRWGRGKVTLHGVMQKDSPIYDDIVCEPWVKP